MESEEEEGQEASVVSMATYDDANSSSEYENDVQEVQQPEQGKITGWKLSLILQTLHCAL